MNYVEIMGGLGNQLFQYAFAKCVEDVTGIESVLYISFFDNNDNRPGVVKRDYSLNKFNFQFNTAKGNLTVSRIIKEYEKFTVQYGDDNIFFSGFWQDKSYCNGILDTWRKNIGLKEWGEIDSTYKLVADELNSGNSISLHVRRGDYLDEDNVKKYGDITPEYYKRALDKIIAEHGHEGESVLYVFSDDISYCESFISDIWQGRFVMMPMRKDYEDMYLMTKARHHIIANSTFSWWGAALSNRDGITISPANWYRKRDSKKLYLDDWIVI